MQNSSSDSATVESNVYNLIIIGSGPAAWTAAIYAARANLKPLVLEGAYVEENRLKGTLPGGQLSLTTEVENYPGFPEGIDGPVLIQRMKEQAIKYGAAVEGEDVRKVNGMADGSFSVEIVKQPGSRAWYDAKAVIVATGASAKYLGVIGEEAFKNRGVSACAVCDGALPRFRDQPVAVVGGGDSACEEATYLSKYASKVYMIVRKDKLRASKVMADRVMANPKIEIIWKADVVMVGGNDEDGLGVLMVEVNERGTDAWEVRQLYVTGMFVAIGHSPNSSFLTTTKVLDDAFKRTEVLVDEHGFVQTDRDNLLYTTMTHVPGLFVAGDVADPRYKQAITAAGSGCKAALDAERWLSHVIPPTQRREVTVISDNEEID